MFLKIAHRGASGNYPENTLLAFQEAIHQGADMLEFDVHVCQSGELVVIHDDTLERTTNGHGLVKDTHLNQLKTLDAGLGEEIPTLLELLTELKGTVQLNIELKGDGTGVPVFKLLEQIVQDESNHWTYDHFLISSFKQKELEAFDRLNKKMKIGIVFEQLPDNIKLLLTMESLFSIHLPFSQVSQKTVDAIHALGLKLLVWTVDKPADVEAMKMLGVDGVFSNYPDRL